VTSASRRTARHRRGRPPSGRRCTRQSEVGPVVAVDQVFEIPRAGEDVRRMVDVELQLGGKPRASACERASGRKFDSTRSRKIRARIRRAGRCADWAGRSVSRQQARTTSGRRSHSSRSRPPVLASGVRSLCSTVSPAAPSSTPTSSQYDTLLVASRLNALRLRPREDCYSVMRRPITEQVREQRRRLRG
jgi:hypothetical protein